MSSGYTVELKDGRPMFNATWLPSVALENLSKIGKHIGLGNLMAIIETNEMSVHTVILAISESEDSKTTMDLIKHFVCTAVIDGDRIEAHSFDHLFTGKLPLVIEVFCHVCKAQYSDFLESGLVKV